jgi:triacylglycerol lipase
MTIIKRTLHTLLLLCFTAIANNAVAACVDAVVLVHGNTSSPNSWDNTYNYLLSKGYSPADIYRPDWGSKSCAGCNNHSGTEETPVRQAISSAIANSCTGKIDVIGHSMGATLAAQQIDKLAAASYVDSFVGVAGAFRGLKSCGYYPYNVWVSTCGSAGLSVSSPFLDGLYGTPLAERVYSIKSYSDQIVCSTGSCLVYGVHSSRIWGENATYNYSLDHFGLQTDTAEQQYLLIK